MALSRQALEFAAEIFNHDWSDSPFKADQAGHRRSTDRAGEVLTREETSHVRANVMLVVAQVLGHQDPNFDPLEFAEACGVEDFTEDSIRTGLRISLAGQYATPGTWDHM
ncbi:hypothetical protein ACWCPD_27095 [Streptomyces sp. NPDC001935]|uniref:hypothetical protein n=1 Tax=Streptomyces sp. NPDC056738 TaxID=3345933 RepID=UPI003677B677